MSQFTKEEQSEIRIRPLECDDLASVALLMEELSESAHSDALFSVERFEPLFHTMAAQPDLYLNLVAVAENSVVGFLSVVFYRSFFHEVGTALINELVVTASHRGKGIGGSLVDAARTEARRRGMDEIEVGTETGNTAARAFYRNHGFTEEYVLLGMEFSQAKTA